MSAVWREHLVRDGPEGHARLDVGHDYYTRDPEQVEADVAALCHAAARERIRRCTLVCGRGIHNPTGERGKLRARVEALLERRTGRTVQAWRETAGGGALEVEFLWAERSQAQREAADRTRSRLREIPILPDDAAFVRARAILVRIFHDWRIVPPDGSRLGPWLLRLDRARGVPPEVVAEVAAETARWALWELGTAHGVPLPQRLELAHAVADQLGDPARLHEILELVSDETYWREAFDQLVDGMDLRNRTSA